MTSSLPLSCLSCCYTNTGWAIRTRCWWPQIYDRAVRHAVGTCEREGERERTQILSDIGSTIVHSSELATASYLAALQEGEGGKVGFVSILISLTSTIRKRKPLSLPKRRLHYLLYTPCPWNSGFFFISLSFSKVTPSVSAAAKLKMITILPRPLCRFSVRPKVPKR